MKIDFFKHNIKNSKDLSASIKNNYLTSGNKNKEVEKLINTRFGSKNCILTNSWTNGVIAILKAINLKKDDEVIVPNYTFVACSNVVEIIGAKPIFVDICKDTLLMSIDDCLKKISKKTKVIMPVHLFGNLFDTKQLKKNINNKIYILEDAAHTFYGKYHGKNIGHFADFTIFSFYATKNITCGEGGAIISKHNAIMSKIRSIANSGMTKSAFNRFTNNTYNHWDVHQPGFKANLSDINASLLPQQIIRDDINAKKRKKIYEKYKKYLSKKIFIPKNNKNFSRDYHLFPIFVEKKIRDKLIKYLFKNNIPVTVNYRSIQKLKYYKNKYKKINCPISKDYGERTLSLPFHLSLNDKQIKFIANKVNLFLNQL